MTDSASPAQTDSGPVAKEAAWKRLLRWLVVLGPSLGIALLTPPEGITTESWRLLAIFTAVVAGMISRPMAGGAMVLLGVLATGLCGVMPLEKALAGYADPIVWLVLAAFFISRGMIKTGLGRRIALLFIRAIGHRSLGLAYALAVTDMMLAMVIPSNGARAGGIIFPIAKSLSEAYGSHPGSTAQRLGAFLMVVVYQCDVIACAMFMTGQASNVLIARLANENADVHLTYADWAIGAVLPGLASLIVVPWLLYRLFPPEITSTPAAAEFAAAELRQLGALRWPEMLMLVVFALTAGLWMTTSWHGLHYAAVALTGVALLLVTGVIDWDDVIRERAAWDVFIWYGGLVRMAEALGETGLTHRFAEASASFTVGWTWWAALMGLLLVYFYAHYAFASITAHASAMFIPFLVVSLAAGAPPLVAVLTLTYFSNLDASLTHYGTTPAPIYFGAGYVEQRTWWLLGLIVSVPNILIWMLIGPLWWKLLGWW